MEMSFSVPLGLAYVADEAQPDRPAAGSVDEAAHQTVRNFPSAWGGAKELARRMGVPLGTLDHKVNLNNDTHFLRPEELCRLQEVAADFRVLHAMALRLGMEVRPALPDVSGGDPIKALLRMHTMLGEFLRAATEPLEAPGGPTRNHLRHTQEAAADLVTAIGHVVAAQRSSMRAAPRVEG